MGFCCCYLRSDYSNRRELESIKLSRWDDYVEWLSGTDVWSMAVKSSDGLVKSTDSMNIATDCDFAIRKTKVAYLMKEGID